MIFTITALARVAVISFASIFGATARLGGGGFDTASPSSPLSPPHSPLSARLAAEALSLSLRHSPISARLAAEEGCTVFCWGPLLQAVQLVDPPLFVDSKTFVDMPLRVAPSVALAAFADLPYAARSGSDRAALATFVGAHFEPAGSDLHACAPSDWSPSVPTAYAGLSSPRLRSFLTSAVHRVWPALTRCVDARVALNPDRHSLLAQPYPLVVPGGRFRETYYFDTLYIISGLLASDMGVTARGLVENLRSLMERDTDRPFVPNGGRSYYALPGRSQPPLFLASAFAVAEGTGDYSIVDASYPAAAAEHAWWMRTHAVHIVDATGAPHILNRYIVANQTTPRAESYREDHHTAARAGLVGTDASALYSALAGICESGWDFSSRWLGDGGRLETARPHRVIPADLNSFLLHTERLLATAATRLGLDGEAAYYSAAAEARVIAIDAVLWDDASAQWRDGVAPSTLRNGSAAHPWVVGVDLGLAPAAAASNFYPLWAGVGRGDGPRVRRIVEALESSGLIAAGGVMATTRRTGEQWDAPGSWAPIASALVDGLRAAGEPSATRLARELARRWVKTAHDGWAKHGVMFEKYDAVDGGSGGGGEYAPEEGFGWTNGVTARFSIQYDFTDEEIVGA